MLCMLQMLELLMSALCTQVREGDDATFVATISEDVDEIVWTHFGDVVEEDERHAIFEENGRHFLEVYCVTAEDEGEYIAIAENVYGFTQSSAHLFVTGKDCDLLSPIFDQF